jgi:hypothetical protein
MNGWDILNSTGMVKKNNLANPTSEIAPGSTTSAKHVNIQLNFRKSRYRALPNGTIANSDSIAAAPVSNFVSKFLSHKAVKYSV